MKKLHPVAFAVPIVIAALVICSFHGNSKSTAKSTKKLDTIGLPDAYKSRKFMSGDAVSGLDAGTIPGNVVKYDATSATYEIMTMKAIIKGNKQPVAQTPPNAAIYQGQVTSTSDFNGSYLINGLKADDNQVIDIEIRDAAIYVVPDGQIDTATIKTALQSIAASDRKNYFYVTTATESVISYKFHAAENAIDKANKKADKVNKKLDDLGKNDTAKNGVYMKVTPPKSNKKAPGSYDASNTKMLTDKVISIQITPIDDIIKPAAVKK